MGKNKSKIVYLYTIKFMYLLTAMEYCTYFF